jgi:hypothetical protein
MRKEIKIFYIKILDRKALLVPYTLGRNVTFSMFKEPMRYLLLVSFVIFFLFVNFPYMYVLRECVTDLVTRLSVRIYRSIIMLIVLTYFANLGKLG